jgi:nucleotide-binding universal stress UspA family protein
MEAVGRILPWPWPLPVTAPHRGEIGRIMVTTQLTAIGVGIHNVLIATDFSRFSNQALDIGLKLSQAYKAHAYVAFVVPSDEFMLAGPDAYVAAKEAARRDLENLKLDLKKTHTCIEGRDYHLYLLEGDVATSILHFAQQKQVDLIVLGTHGRGGLEKALMGSVAERVFRASTVPVLTIGPHARHASHALAPKNILAAADFSPAGERAARYAAGLAAEHHSRLTLLHVVNPKELEHVPDRDRVLQAMDENLRELLGPEAGACDRRVECGRVAATILRTVHELNADMLVLGVHPAPEVLTRFMWPIAYEVVREASCPVLTVRERDR